MQEKWLVLLVVVLGVGLLGAFISEDGTISAEPQQALQSPDFQIEVEPTGPPPPPPPGCRALVTAVKPIGGGTVDVDPEPNCGATWYVIGSNVTLTAVPNNNYNFLYWGGTVAGIVHRVCIRRR